MIGDGRSSSPAIPFRMSLVRRFSTLLFGLLFLQLTVLGDGAACRAHGSAGSGASMAAMPMVSAPQDRAPSSHDGCDAERAASRCATMPSCATALVAPVRVVALVHARPMAQALPEPVSIHSQPAAGPDVPPPRG